VNSKVPITIGHLLTHTSGLPDMLPNNLKLRAAHAPLSEFVKGACAVTRDFPAGHAVQYQSMGFAVLGAIIETISGRTCRDFLREEFFEPLGMASTSLGATDEWFDGAQPVVDRIAGIRLPEQQRGTDWHWNSRYWRSLGAPWGGLLTTPEDLGKYAQMMLREGRGPESAILSPASVAAATRNQLAGYGGVPEEDRRCRPWGYGWRLQWPAHSASFGALVGPRAYGHWGATGTMLWIDPERDAFAAILSTQPLGRRDAALIRISNALAACFR
jgi:CubicO group peptidase (beta-lactamase class C family)